MRSLLWYYHGSLRRNILSGNVRCHFHFNFFSHISPNFSSFSILTCRRNKNLLKRNLVTSCLDITFISSIFKTHQWVGMLGWHQLSYISFFFFFLIYLFVAALGLCCCVRAFSSCSELGLLFVAVRGLLIVVASPCRAQALGARASVVVARGLQ